ncbi:MAG: hypothetical protein LUG86_09625 [Oscillospiraceae bacterium]|nr:hypothetical protein [Oscillospiraceae bacterium]
MIEFKKNIDERKTLVKKLEELTGERSVYTRAPEYAFLIGDYKVDRQGNLLVDENSADQDILVTLLTEGLIAMPDEEETEAATEEEAEATVDDSTEDEAAAAEEPAEEVPTGETSTAELPTEDDESVGADTAEAGTAAEEAEEQEVEPQAGAQETAPQENETPAEETEAEEPVESSAEGEPNILHISFPADKHNGVSLRNLVYLIYSRAELINKATGAHFRVDEGLIEALKDDACTYSALNFRKAVGAYEDEHGLSMEGLIITPEEITFTGFAAGMDADHCKACTDLAAAMNQMAIKQKRIQPKAKHADNEKYAFRIWLVRMEMGGDEYKKTRKLLMENLSGHTAFRTPEAAERAKEKALRARAAERAEQEENEGEAQTSEPL